ncbi:zinc-binding dehydrogenase [Nocardioides litoris]|uniref:zinc-binding dehydrogenase n=1 Tax=Nocardioides litoris TaxID=1926648 RepID=UPI00112436C7|nr:zinc-binding dehydrogenase [Nocardioides litoris]
MRAVVLTRFGGPEVLEERELPDPHPGPGEVVVRVGAVSINNTDVWTRAGAYGTDEPAGWLGPIDFPRVQGADVCGEVVEVGAGVDEGLLGRRVLVDPVLRYADGPEPLVEAVLGSEADGGYAERVLVRADRVHDVTDSPLTTAQLACLPISYGTATGMLERARVRRGETVLVSGASGGVGLALVALSAARGAHVVALSSADKADAVRQAGAQVVVDRRQGDIAEQLADLVPAGLDAVADVVGGDLLATAMPRLRPGGRWVVAGAVAGPIVQLDLRSLYLRSIALLGSTMHTPEQFGVLVAAANEGAIAPVVAQTHPLRAAGSGHEQFERRAHVGKIVLEP